MGEHSTSARNGKKNLHKLLWNKGMIWWLVWWLLDREVLLFHLLYILGTHFPGTLKGEVSVWLTFLPSLDRNQLHQSMKQCFI